MRNTNIPSSKIRITYYPGFGIPSDGSRKVSSSSVGIASLGSSSVGIPSVGSSKKIKNQ